MSTHAVHTGASVDQLTDLLNRTTFSNGLAQLTSSPRSDGLTAALVVLDVVHFRMINFEVGFSGGDAVLRALARHLSDEIQPIDLAARLGDNEFGFVLPDVEDAADAMAAAQAVYARLDQASFWRSFKPSVRLAFGLAIRPQRDGTAADWLTNATIAVGVAKKPGGGGVVLYAPEMRARVDRRTEVGMLVREALSSDSMTPYYQPKVSLRSGHLVGLEALLRWRHPTDGLQLPGRIALALEDPEFAFAIADRMLDSVLSDIRRWLELDVDFKTVAINVSAVAFTRPNYANHILHRLALAGIEPHYLEVEVTEHAILHDASDAVGRELQILADAGVTIALDDFGTGYISLHHLARFPLHSVKLDTQFVHSIMRDKGCQLFAAGIIRLARSLGLTTIAEGVESKEQAEFLVCHQCDVVQGFLFAEALASDQVPGYVANLRPDAVIATYMSPIDTLA